MSDAMTETVQTTPPADAATPQSEQRTWLARIRVTLKPVVLDPQGDAVLTGLRQLGFAQVGSVRVGTYLEVTLTAARQDDAEATVRQMCDRLLANPVIERYDFSIEAGQSRAE